MHGWICNALSHTTQGWVLFLNNTIYRDVVFYSILCLYLMYKKTLFKPSYHKLGCGLGAQPSLGAVRHSEPWALPQPAESGCKGPAPGSGWRLSPWSQLPYGRASEVHPFSLPGYSLRCTLKWLIIVCNPGRGALDTLWVPGPRGTHTSA